MKKKEEKDRRRRSKSEKKKKKKDKATATTDATTGDQPPFALQPPATLQADGTALPPPSAMSRPVVAWHMLVSHPSHLFHGALHCTGWSCSACTYWNAANAVICEICTSVRIRAINISGPLPTPSGKSTAKKNSLCVCVCASQWLISVKQTRPSRRRGGSARRVHSVTYPLPCHVMHGTQTPHLRVRCLSDSPACACACDQRHTQIANGSARCGRPAECFS